MVKITRNKETSNLLERNNREFVISDNLSRRFDFEDELVDDEADEYDLAKQQQQQTSTQTSSTTMISTRPIEQTSTTVTNGNGNDEVTVVQKTDVNAALSAAVGEAGQQTVINFFNFFF